jgi:hypothetical protein
MAYRRQLCLMDWDVIIDVIRAYFESDDPQQTARIHSLTDGCVRALYERAFGDFMLRGKACGLSNFTDDDLDGLWWDLYQSGIAVLDCPAGALELASRVLEGIRRWTANGGHRQGFQAQPGL